MSAGGTSGDGAASPAGPRGLAWLWALVAGAVLTQTALNLARPVTSYHLLALGASDVAVGLATAAYALLPLLGALWLGRVTDRAPSAVPVVAAGALVLAAGGAGLALARDVAGVVAASAVLGLGHLAFTIAAQAAIARRAAAAGVVPVLITPQARRRPPRPSANDAGPAVSRAGTPRAGAILARPGVRSAMGASLALLAVLDILTAFLPLVGERHGVGAGWVGVLLALRGAGSLVSRALLPVVRRRFSR